MKKTLLTAAACLAICLQSEAGQGNVHFNNKVGLDTDANKIRAIVTENGTPVSAANYRAQLYYSATSTDPNTFIAVGTARTFRTSANAGYWNFEDVIITDPNLTQGGTVNLQARAWRDGATWESALARGVSNVLVNFDTGNPVGEPAGEPAPAMFGLEAFQITVVPEPTTIGLSILGLGALAARRRKAKLVNA